MASFLAERRFPPFGLSKPMLNPLKWNYQDQAGLIIATLAGAGFGIAISYTSGNEWLGTLIWTLIGAVILGGTFYFNRPFR